MSVKAKHGVRKELNNELNLTPFIDLLSTMVCFLLISAVWVQIGSLEIKQSYGTIASSTPKVNFEMDLVFDSEKSSQILVKRNGRRFKKIRAKGENFHEMKSKLEESLEKFFNQKKSHPIKVSTLMVTTKPSVLYGQLVEILDIFRKQSISNIGIIPVLGGLD